MRNTIFLQRLNQSFEANTSYQELYVKKMEIRCENQLSHAISMCIDIFSSTYDICSRDVPSYIEIICWSLMLPRVCDVKRMVGLDTCNFKREVIKKMLYTFIRLGKLYIVIIIVICFSLILN